MFKDDKKYIVRKLQRDLPLWRIVLTFQRQIKPKQWRHFRDCKLETGVLSPLLQRISLILKRKNQETSLYPSLRSGDLLCHQILWIHRFIIVGLFSNSTIPVSVGLTIWPVAHHPEVKEMVCAETIWLLLWEIIISLDSATSYLHSET